MEKLTKEKYSITNWSGGTTTQIFIWPPKAQYASRDFAFRISSATVDQETSTFTLLPGVHRFLTTLEGDLQVTTNKQEPVELKPLRVMEFEGEWDTTSVGIARDFNLMVKQGKGSMRTMEVKGVVVIDCPAGHTVIYQVEGKSRIEDSIQAEAVLQREGEVSTMTLEEGTAMHLEAENNKKIKLTTVKKCKFIICQVEMEQIKEVLS